MAATSFSFDPKIVKLIDKLQEDMHAGSRSEVLRRAITLLKLSKDAEKNGAELILKKNGHEQRVIIS
jgi:Arc/MetJ-type ribon-helix-helix transcriptional regulator